MSHTRLPMMRRYVTEVHLHPLFMREVPCALDITRARKAVFDWLRFRLLGPGTSLLELSAGVPAWEVFSTPAPILEDIREAMDALCLEVREEPPTSHCLDGDLHPALLLHWRVQAYLCLLYTSPSPRDLSTSRMPSSA